MNAAIEPLIEQTPYGTNEIGRPYRAGHGNGWERIDIYTTKGTGEVHHERRFAAGEDDLSPMARPMYADKGNCHYHPKCSCCWLGFSHTLALHQREAVGSWD